MITHRPLRPPVATPEGPRWRSTSAGFTVVELLVSIFVLALVLVGVLLLFDMSRGIARTQTAMADLQQAVRIGQYQLVRNVRMTGRGGLPAMLQPFPPDTKTYPGRLLPRGLALDVVDNVGASVKIGNCACAPVLPGTDILSIRGVFSTPIYQINPAGADFVPPDPVTGGGTLTLRETSPSGVPQDLVPISKAVDDTAAGHPEALLLVSPLDDAIYAVVEVAPGSTVVKDVSGKVSRVDLNYRIAGGSARLADYLNISPDGRFPPQMTTVAYAGILEEYKFYIREQYAIPGDTTSDLEPRLTQARVYPGTNVAHEEDDSNLVLDLADDIIDLQVALAVDANNDGVITEGTDAASRKSDEWLFNAPGDDVADTSKWNGTTAVPTRLYYARVTTLARTDQRSLKYQSPLLGVIEDKDYSVPPYDKLNDRTDRMFRYQQIQTVVDLRNLS